MSAPPLDTTPEAWAYQQAVLARMTGEERLVLALEMSDAVREMRVAGIHARNPEASEREVMRILIREDYGIDLPAGW